MAEPPMSTLQFFLFGPTEMQLVREGRHWVPTGAKTHFGTWVHLVFSGGLQDWGQHMGLRVLNPRAACGVRWPWGALGVGRGSVYVSGVPPTAERGQKGAEVQGQVSESAMGCQVAFSGLPCPTQHFERECTGARGTVCARCPEQTSICLLSALNGQVCNRTTRDTFPELLCPAPCAPIP